MKTYITELDSLGEWIERPHDALRKYPGGTVFLLRPAQGGTHVCILGHMMESDLSCRAQRLSDLKHIRLENLRQGALAFVLANNKSSHGGFAPLADSSG